ARDVYGVSVSQKYPIIIGNAYPKDMDLWQSTNTIWASELFLEEQGSLILISNGWDGHSAYPDFAERIGTDPDVLKAAFDRGEIGEKMTAIFGIGVGRFKRRFDMGLVSEGFNQTDADVMGFAYYDSVEQALSHAFAKHGQQAKVAVMTHGGITLPLLKSG
ncbi:MAG: hypothetical protein AAF485_10450, partial [Chloroflexota bacterium]